MNKIRIIQSGGGTVTTGVSIPKPYKHWLGIYVTIKESGNSLILESGALPLPFTKQQITFHSTRIETVKI